MDVNDPSPVPTRLRVALLGAFAFPAPQGSQVFARDQAVALARAGAEVRVLCYGHGEGAAPPGIEVVRVPGFLSPKSYRSGLRALKPAADLALAARTARVVREHRIQVLLAHNAEAALVALASRSAPVVYVAHTLLEEELSAYGPAALGRVLDRAGRALDRAVASRAAATIALSTFAAERLRRHARGPVELLPPGVELHDPPDAEAVAAACARYGVIPGEFVLYAGNLDSYQDLEVLRETAARLPERSFLVATHASPRRDRAPLRVVIVSPEEIRTLTHGAALAVATRRRRGGFPIKLLNYMEAGRAVVAREGQACTLVDGCNARLVGERAGATEFVEAIEELLRDRERAVMLGRAAHATAERAHDWDRIARSTLALTQSVIRHGVGT